MCSTELQPTDACQCHEDESLQGNSLLAGGELHKASLPPPTYCNPHSPHDPHNHRISRAVVMAGDCKDAWQVTGWYKLPRAPPSTHQSRHTPSPASHTNTAAFPHLSQQSKEPCCTSFLMHLGAICKTLQQPLLLPRHHKTLCVAATM